MLLTEVFAMYYDFVYTDKHLAGLEEIGSLLAASEKFPLPLKGRVIYLTYWNLVSSHIYNRFRQTLFTSLFIRNLHKEINDI